MDKTKITLKTKIGYGLSDMGGNLFFTIVNFWLLFFLTDMLGLNPAFAGLAIMIGKLWDAITDPLMGHLSDRTISRWGRRKPYMVAGSIPLFILTVMLFTKVNITDQGLLMAYVTVIYCLVNTAYTVIFVPYTAMLPEITTDYHERTSMFGYRMGFALTASLIGSVLALPIVGMFSDQATGFTGMAVIFGLIMVITILLTVKMVPTVKYEKRMVKSGLLKSYLGVFRNKPFVLVLTAMILCFISLIVVHSSIMYYFTYVLNNPEAAVLGILCLTLASIVFIPVGLTVSKRVGKKTTWIAGMIISIAGYILLYFASSVGLPLVLVSLVICGIGTSGTAVFAGACMADTMEYGCLKTGERNEGSYSGIGTFGQKVGMAFGAAFVGWMLAAFGYIPEQAQTPETIEGIKLVIALIPTVLTLIAAVVFKFYKLTEKEYNKIISEIETKAEV